MKVLVTGASGLLGSHVVAAAIDAGHDVVAVSRGGDLARARELCGRPLVHAERAELSDPVAVRELLDRWSPEAIVHVAARIPADAAEGDPLLFFDDNVRATLNLLRFARECGAMRFVYSSTMSVYGAPRYLPVDEDHPLEPITAYGLSKLEGEWYGRLAAERDGLRVTVLRYSGIYGRGQRRGAIPAFIDCCLRGEPLTLHAGGRQSSDFVWVEDAARANLIALRAEELAPFEVFNIGSGVEIAIAELAEMVRGLCRSSSELRVSDESCTRDFRFAFDVAKAQELLGYAPTEPDRAIARCIEQRAKGEWK